MISTPFLSVPPRQYGGTELVVYELVEGLIERGHEVTLFATGDSRTRAALRSIYAEPQWPPDSLVDLNHVSWAMGRIRPDEFDLIHAHSSMALALSRFVPEIPLVYTLHHDRVEFMSAFYSQFPEVYCVAISHNQRRLETPLERCTVIHHGLDPSQYKWASSPKDYVCFVGRFSKVKGLHTAIDAAREAQVPIRVAGEVHPVDREFGEREIEWRLRLPHVSYLGCVGLEEKAPLLRDARALLSPIEWEEPFGLILIEAMLSGCPVVAYPRGSVPELVEEGITGYIVRTADEMARLIRPGGTLDGFDRARCRERAEERFSRERMAAEHERLYRRVISKKAESQPVRFEPALNAL